MLTLRLKEEPVVLVNSSSFTLMAYAGLRTDTFGVTPNHEQNFCRSRMFRQEFTTTQTLKVKIKVEPSRPKLKEVFIYKNESKKIQTNKNVLQRVK